jgi:hypothetical protein
MAEADGDSTNQPASSATGNGTTSVDSLLERATQAFTALEEYVRQASAGVSTINENQVQVGAVLADAQLKLQEVSAVATQAAAAKSQVTDAQAVIATKSDHIDGAQKHADKVRGDLDRALTAAQAHVVEAEGLKSRAEAIADNVEEIQAAVTSSRADADAARNATRQALSEAQAATAEAQKLAVKADEVDSQIRLYEKNLTELTRRSDEQLNTIISLLPGATSAGLASAFDARRQTFLGPSNRWQQYFVWSIFALVIVAGTGLLQVYLNADALTYEKLIRLWLARLPIAGALIWLALYASREAALAKRLEEDYGFKAAIAASFQGFQKQMHEIHETVGADSPLAKLCYNTLAEISNPPGRIYDKHELTVSPSGEVKELVGAVTETVGKVVAKPASS